MTTLSDRYVWAVLRSLPEAQRPELEPEIRALVADAVDAHAAATPDHAAAERAALVELGDPDVLAGRYVDRKSYVIGPVLYPHWLRLLKVLVPLVPTVVGLAVGGATLAGGSTVGSAIASGLASGINVAIQTVFWVTLVFALLERATPDIALPEGPWTPDQLPAVPDRDRSTLMDAAWTAITSVLLAGALVWQQVAPPIVIDGVAYPLIDPALWSFWMPYFLVVIGLDLVFAGVLFMQRRWTWPLAVVNAVLAAAFAIPALSLLVTDRLFNPALVAQVTATTGRTWTDVGSTVVAISVAVIVGVDVLDGFRKARRDAQAWATGPA